MSGFAEVSFKGTRRGYFRVDALDLSLGDPVIVQTDRGEDMGRVTALGSIAERKCSSSGGCATPAPTLRVIRRAGAEEVSRARHKALIIYFTAEKRVDFRALVRDLARAFRTRIELKQIGVRDEAALLGGVGRCGRELCCSTWLPELQPVSLQLAKDQSLSLNPAQISGCCGRLMCCLMYEHQSYVDARRRFPREGRKIRTAQGYQRVVSVNIFNETITLRSDDGQQRVVGVADLKKEMAARPGR